MAMTRPPGLSSSYQFRKALWGSRSVHSRLRLTMTSKLPAEDAGSDRVVDGEGDIEL